LAGRPEASVGSPALPEADLSAHDGARASARPSTVAQVSPLAPLNADLNSDVPASLAHQLNDCFVLLKRLSLAAGVDAVLPRMDAASQTPRRLSVDEISEKDDERLLLQGRSVPETPDEHLPMPLLPTVQRQVPLAGQTF